VKFLQSLSLGELHQTALVSLKP